ncbi:hypothetical protein AGDE_01811 [Angomonas deanei]|uniref:Uncharacterized protein n=1 Tax=Angomonas deanei TaxID=59799 RepID=A0A7G2CAP0_9TRYP|nr:hypothetical protein AGDE_01811 [Angomonas deanei]CAD2215092.1 hypothetical protein, conserved [Angomonas deanei]|eukprot:EPY42112.1 hypothetical protein AGDE_01811 [Angomonas deanei]
MDSLTHLLFTNDHRNVVIEIGCGCGLVGMTACTVLQEEQHHIKNNNHITYIYTDAEEDCLALVRASGAVNNERKHNTLLSICDGTKKSDMCVSDHGLCQLTFPLCWGEEGVDTLRTFLNEKMNSHYSMPLILGSDLIYYNVNLTVLLRTCQSLFSTGSGNSKYRFLLLAHYVRIPNGHEVLYQTAKDLNFKIVKINLHSFLDSARIQERGWGSAELVLLVYTTAGGKHAMQEDVPFVKQILLEKRNTAAPSVQQQLDTLHQHVEPYLGTSDKNTEEEMLLLFNDLI